jgi:hypothetical protein
MNRFAGATWLLALAALAEPAAAAVLIDNLTVRPNPVRFSGGYPPQVEIEVTIKDHGITRLLGCELTIDFGDGTPVVLQSIADGGTRKATLKHAYAKAGAFDILVRGKPGSGGRACDGERRIAVKVIDETPPPEPAPAKEAPPVSATCPPGWSLVPNSQTGARFKCRADRPKIECPVGTKFVEQEGTIGCQ